jgi:hypothetical protein
VHALKPVAVADIPTEQLVHTEARLAPAEIEYFPTTQPVQVEEPTLIAYLPAAQFVQADARLAPTDVE